MNYAKYIEAIVKLIGSGVGGGVSAALGAHELGLPPALIPWVALGGAVLMATGHALPSALNFNSKEQEKK